MGSQALALFFRALRVDVRLLHSHVMRLALLVFVLLTMFSAHMVSMAMGAPGLIFFTQITFINLAFASLAGPLLFATCITEEKEDQTLGLLRMANVRPITILTGKLAPRLANALLILVVQFPFTLLAITLGGVTWLQVWVAFWGLLAHTFLVGNIGMLCSVVFRRTGTAVGCTVALVVAHFLVPAIGYGLLSSTAPPAAAVTSSNADVEWYVAAHEFCLSAFDYWYHATAWALMSNVLTTGFGGGALNLQVVSNFAAGAVIFILAWLVFNRCNRDVDVASTGATRTLSDLLKRRGRRSIRAWSSGALIGREFQFACGGYTAWFVKLLAYGPAVYLLAVLFEGSRRGVDADEFGALLMWLMLFLVLPLEAVVLSSRVFRGEIKERTWSSLLMLPRSLAAISYSKIAGSTLALVPVVFYFVLGSVLNPDGIIDFLRELDEPETLVAIFVMIASFIFLLHLVCWFAILTNAWVGILLAVATWFASMFMWQLCIMTPVMMGAITGATATQTMMVALYAVMGCGLLIAAALLHWHIAFRLRRAAAAT